MTTALEFERRGVGGSGVELPRVSLGCGNFGGVGSAPLFFGQGLNEDQAFELMDAAWELGLTHFDLYPFILLNLAFSLQAAYAAPLILLAQTRQADRDKAHSEADAQHREDLAQASVERQVLAQQQSAELMNLLEQNTRLTQLTQELTQRIKELTDQIHSRLTAA